MSAHTKGPWTTDGGICPVTGSISVVARGPIVYVTDNSAGAENQVANARLIAAAPELLEALEQFAACAEVRDIVAGNTTLACAVFSARAAIAKARGN